MLASIRTLPFIVVLMSIAITAESAEETVPAFTPQDRYLIQAASKGMTSIIGWLITLGANINCRDSQGNTPLICAINNGHTETVRCLLKLGAEANARSSLPAIRSRL